jgi:hypothetical protein
VRKSPFSPEELLRGALEELAAFERSDMMARPTRKIIPRRCLALIQEINQLRHLVKAGRMRVRRRESKGIVLAFKAKAAAACESCGWSHSMPSVAMRVLHCHHVVPIAAGGDNEASNLIILCANCHAIAHSIASEREIPWRGPTTRAELLAALKSDPLNNFSKSSKRA